MSLGNICEKIELLSTFLSFSKSGTYLGKKGFPSYMFTEKKQNKNQKKIQIEYTSLNYIQSFKLQRKKKFKRLFHALSSCFGPALSVHSQLQNKI